MHLQTAVAILHDRTQFILNHQLYFYAGGKKGSSGGGLDAASMRQLMGRPEGPPVRYLMTQLTGLSQPLTYPDHGGIMELRNAKAQ